MVDKVSDELDSLNFVGISLFLFFGEVKFAKNEFAIFLQIYFENGIIFQFHNFVLLKARNTVATVLFSQYVFVLFGVAMDRLVGFVSTYRFVTVWIIEVKTEVGLFFHSLRDCYVATSMFNHTFVNFVFFQQIRQEFNR